METNTGMNEPVAVAAPDGSDAQNMQADSRATGTKEAAPAEQPSGVRVKHDPTAEERRYYADQNRQRREAEHQRELQAVRDENRAVVQRLEAFVKRHGFETFDDMERQGIVEKINRELRGSGSLNADTLSEAMCILAQSAQAAPQTAFQADDQTAVEAQMRELQHEFQAFLSTPDYADSGIKDFRDLARQEWYPRFCSLVSTGELTVSEAFEVVNRNALSKRRSDSVRQATLNAVYGKEHLKSAEGGGEGLDGVIVPEDVYEQYKSWFPKWNRRQIEGHYAQYLREIQGAT